MLDVFQGIMRILNSSMVFGLGVWLFWECWRISPQRKKQKLVFWSAIVVVCSFGVEWLGVRTGKIFGAYTYGQTLRPLIDGVPACIGAAWFVMLISSAAVVQRFGPKSVVENSIRLALWTALLMVCFDLFLEPAAGKLDYWTWVDNRIPLQNYLAWFGLSFIFTMLGIRMGLFSQPPLPRIAFHFYLAQLIYFGLVDLKSL